jgi:Cu(I)/Ag(I) efflux system membrane fusion protein
MSTGGLPRLIGVESPMIKKATVSLLLCAAIAIAFVAGSWRARQETVSASGLHGRRILYYVDPMHPSYKSDTPGIAPDCNMPLEPVYADGGAPPDIAPNAATAHVITVDAAKQQVIGVRVAAVEETAGAERIRLFGRVAAAETRIYKMNAGLDGYVRDLSGVTTGSAVRKDEWLLTYSSPEIRQPIAGFVSTLDALDRETRNGTVTSTQMEFARTAEAQAYDRLIVLGMSPLQIAGVRASRTIPANVEVTAPAGGFIIARNVTAGEKIMKGSELFRLADLRQVWVIADVPPGDAERVQPGMRAEISVGGRVLPAGARVSGAVLPQFDAATQSAKIRLEIDNPGFVLRPDMFVDVHLLIPYAATMTVPADALVASGLRTTVFLERSAGVFEPRQVRTGRTLGDRVEILHGLVDGDRIVTSGTFLLDAETRMHGHDQ